MYNSSYVVFHKNANYTATAGYASNGQTSADPVGGSAETHSYIPC